jgi:hypothetical protein
MSFRVFIENEVGSNMKHRNERALMFEVPLRAAAAVGIGRAASASEWQGDGSGSQTRTAIPTPRAVPAAIRYP